MRQIDLEPFLPLNNTDSIDKLILYLGKHNIVVDYSMLGEYLMHIKKVKLQLYLKSRIDKSNSEILQPQNATYQLRETQAPINVKSLESHEGDFGSIKPSAHDESNELKQSLSQLNEQPYSHKNNIQTDSIKHDSVNTDSYTIPNKYKDNEEQMKVLSIDDGYNLVLAPPGCGKTDILAERIARAYYLGVDFKDMLCLTFTNRAAKGMKERIETRLEERTDVSDLFVGNIHRFCSKFLFGNHLIPMLSSVLDEVTTLHILQSFYGVGENENTDEEYKSFYLRAAKLQHYVFQLKNGFPEELLLTLDSKVYRNSDKGIDINIDRYCKKQGKSLLELYDSIDTNEKYSPRQGQDYSLIYHAKQYEEYKMEHMVIDFDDLLLLTYLFLKDEKQNFPKYRWIQVDEVQDLNPLQFAIIDKLTSKENPVVVYLGDEQQAIFSFMGANLESLQHLKERCANRVYNLSKNYRSPQYLLDVYNEYAANVLDVDESSLPESLVVSTTGCKDLVIHNSGTSDQQAEDISSIAIAKSVHGERTAILVNSNDTADKISNTFDKKDIKHFKISGTDVFLMPDIQMLIAHLKVVYQELDFISWAKIFKQLGLFSEPKDARAFAKSITDNYYSPVDFLRYEGSSYVNEIMKSYNQEIVVFDTETTGLNIYEDDIVQIAAIRIKRGKIDEKFNVFIQTEKEIPAFLGLIENPLVKIYDKVHKQSRNEALTKFLQFVGTAPLLGHNVEYDYRILQYNLERDCGILDFEHSHPIYFDSIKLTKLVEPHLQSYKLERLIDVFRLKGNNSHLADDDAQATLELVQYCMNKARSNIKKQRLFYNLNIDTILKFKSKYQSLYHDARSTLYKRLSNNERPAMIKELEKVYNYLIDHELIEKNDKFHYIMKFLESDIISHNEKSLYEQLSAHVVELNTFKEADLCDSDIITEKYFISTVHKAKGLEFDNVIVSDVVDDVYPDYRHQVDRNKQLEDARQLYVAISRAKKSLCLMTYDQKIVHSNRYGKTYYFDTEASPFIKDIRHLFKEDN